MIIDTDYHNIIFHNKTIDDLGIDAVYIDDESEEIKINLFNFKFREKFNSIIKRSVRYHEVQNFWNIFWQRVMKK